MSYLFTSESVTEGHPDKLCDQVSDSLLDAFIKEDPNSRVAVETLATTGLIVVAGEVTSTAKVDVQKVVRETVKRIGYDDPSYFFDADSCAVLVALHEQSPDISQGVSEGQGLYKEQGAGDQGLMFGFACDETPELMPLAITLAHKLSFGLSKLRKDKKIPWLRPDGKTQVTVEYENNVPKRIHTVVVSTQHDTKVTHEEIQKTLIEKLITPICGDFIDDKTIFHINPTGRFVIGGPAGDSGLTGRKIIVDTYGGYGAHGGGAFSGKDPSKVDRSAAYAARHIAKNIVAAGLAKRVEVQIAYAIGVAEPVSIRVDTKGTGTVSDAMLEAAVKKVYKLTPKGIINFLDLKKPIYAKTASYGHFGRDGFTWEKLDKVEELKKAVADF